MEKQYKYVYTSFKKIMTIVVTLIQNFILIFFYHKLNNINGLRYIKQKMNKWSSLQAINNKKYIKK